MPELPEVEVQLRYLKRAALGQAIERVIIRFPGIIKSPHARAFAIALRRRRMVKASRRGKYIIITLDNGRVLILHFGMGGGLCLFDDRRERPEYARIEFVLESGKRLAFTCPRNICRVMLVDKPGDVPALRNMGAEPLARGFTLAYLERVIDESPSRRIKPLLMDQRRIAGVGNIYADQILFEAGVRPDRRASTLSEHEIKCTHRETRRVLRRAIATAGEDEFPAYFLASRAGRREGCPRCGGEILRKKLNGRTAHFCRRCQQ